ncbi:4-hydroxythreonine-4-phosphate dehydrogenase PdxA [Namhaeicola litoreus]|uniref:4-hydroxythreonine-4-phosphate dehydrogenase PdxA n=1 Tax=Namhaeicola litoreus TaxID=1052145 RepID=A0ABW3XXM5_9FLAO
MKESDKIIVGISIGDANGIGIEVILKTFEDARVLEFCTPVVFGSTKVMSYYKKILNSNIAVYGIDNLNDVLPNKFNVFNVWKENVDIEPGKATEISGRYAFKSLESATSALKNGAIDVLITAPINKENIQSKEFNFNGHTEFLESKLQGKSLMILMADSLRVGLITGHVPLKDVADLITQERIMEKVEIMHKTLKSDFSIRKPKIAVLGLNPHAGDNGLIGKEDEEIVKPTIDKCRENNMLVLGPYAADGFFGSETYKQFDGVLAMYHDQGLAPFKTLSFGKGVNFTAGLTKIRTSPDHGTAYDIAGQNKSNHQSFTEAMFTAIKIFKNRSEFNELNEKKLVAKGSK